MDTETWLRLVQLIIAGGGLIAVILTLQQKTNSDNRSEWWRRFTWAVETVDNDKATEQCRRAAEIQLDCLSESPLARSSEQSLIAQFYEMDDNESNIIGEKDGGNDDNNVD
ncbi:hypothetical protein [Corynebacterium parakroppenstedtii]|uniref:hypothetical protein n=1 Tax=Corynebacterium parakroppenstedtii TaxID=2828363 RepID=UPI001C8F3FF7|nr:hypothetical protein [Corynebacterium parakroppenstedtii]MBY0794316.1 hypothetical protein [Corynebacterium parakroppenstedtii]